jgi:hypothetical protein
MADEPLEKSSSEDFILKPLKYLHNMRVQQGAPSALFESAGEFVI